MHVLKMKASEPTGMAKEIKTDLAPLSYCILQHILTTHCSFWQGRGDQVLHTKIPHHQRKSLQQDVAYRFFVYCGNDSNLQYE